MSEAAQAEAEQIVGRLAASYTTCMAQNITAQQEHFPEEWLRSSEDERDEMHRRLVAALAAAIELQDAKDARDNAQYMWADVRLRDALSALRTRR